MNDSTVDGGKPPDPPDQGKGQGGVGGGNDVDMEATTINNTDIIPPAQTEPKPERPKVFYDENIACDTFKVLVQANRNATDLSYHKFGQELAQVSKNSSEILFKEKLSRDKILVTCKNAKMANTLVKDETLAHKYNVFIPQNYVSRYAIIRDIDIDITEEDLFHSLETRQFKLNSVQRLNRRTVNESGKVIYVPSRTMKLNFAGQDIPANVFLWYSKIECEPFIQSTLQCYTCLRFGHASNKCKAKFEACKKCFQIQKPGHVCQTTNIKCLNCDGLHNPKSKDCPELKRQKEIKFLMSTRNLCFQEAVKIIPSTKQSKSARVSKVQSSSPYIVNTSNSFSVLGDLNENFPDLPSRGSNDEKLERYVPPPLTYRSSTARQNKGNQSQKKTLKRYSRPTSAGFDFTKKMKNDSAKEKQENSVAPLFFKLAAERKYDEMLRDNSQSPHFNSKSKPSVISSSNDTPNFTGFSSINHDNNQNRGHTGVELVGPNVHKIRSNSFFNRNFVHHNRFELNSTQNTLEFSDDDLLDASPKSPHLG